MKKTLLLLVAAMLTTMFASAQVSDTIVSMTPSNRNVVLEEYTGIQCQFCPDGHKRANQIKAQHPDRVCLINIHEGGYAANTYTTQFGSALANQTGLEGYPSGTVNRHVFSGSATAMGRGDWANAANTILNMSSPVNIAAEGTLDWATRTLSLRVQLYYTASQTVSSNALNIAIIQDNVLGSQVGATTWYPEMMVGNQYKHMHMLRHLITGQWGETINDITPGTLVEKTYEYVIPAQLGSPNAINAALEDLVFVAFVCEGHQEVLTGIEIPIQHLNLPAIGGRIAGTLENPNTSCTDVTNVQFTFTNLGANTVTSLTYTYTLNNTPHTETWSGSIESMQSGTVVLPDLHLNLGVNNSLQINVTEINGQSITTTPATMTLKKNVYIGGGNMTFIIKTDNYGSETTFKFFAPDGSVVLSGGPFSNSSAVHEFAFNPPTTGCYR
nr:Omp28-related outer membrane protein [Bacteroidales bacterium]